MITITDNGIKIGDTEYYSETRMDGDKEIKVIDLGIKLTNHEISSILYCRGSLTAIDMLETTGDIKRDHPAGIAVTGVLLNLISKIFKTYNIDVSTEDLLSNKLEPTVDPNFNLVIML